MSDEMETMSLNVGGTSKATGREVTLDIELRFTEGEFEAAMSLLAQAGATDLARSIVQAELGDYSE